MKKVISMLLTAALILSVIAFVPGMKVSAYTGYEALQLGISSGYSLNNVGGCAVVKNQYLSIAPAAGTNGALDGAEVCQIDSLYTAFKNKPVTENKFLALRVKTNVSGLTLRLRPITSDHYGNTSNGQYFWTSYDASVSKTDEWETIVVNYDNFNFYDNELDKTGYIRQIRFDLCCAEWIDGTSYIYVSDVGVFSDESTANSWTGSGINETGSYDSSNTGSICVDFMYVNNEQNDALREGGEALFECEEGTVISWAGWCGNFGKQIHRLGVLVNGTDVVWDTSDAASMNCAESPELVDYTGAYGFRYRLNYTVGAGIQNVVPVGQLTDGTIVPIAFAKSPSWNFGKEIPATPTPENPVEEPTQAPETSDPTQAPGTDAPQTGDTLLIGFAAIVALAAAAVVFAKKRSDN